jgi:hypothetical protein
MFRVMVKDSFMVRNRVKIRLVNGVVCSLFSPRNITLLHYRQCCNRAGLFTGRAGLHRAGPGFLNSERAWPSFFAERAWA